MPDKHHRDIGEIRRLNSLRGLAALIVAISHFSNQTNWLDGVLGHGAGQFGVMLFFLLSGFLMAYLYANQEFTITNIRKYASARSARVLPLFFAVVLVSYALTTSNVDVGQYKIADTDMLLSHLFFLSGKSVLWTIPPEIQFYVIFVALWWGFSKSQKLGHAIMATVALIGFFSPETIRGHIEGLFYDFRILGALPYFVFGALLGQIFRRFGTPKFQSHFFVLALLLIPPMYPAIISQVFGVSGQMWDNHLQIWSDPMVFVTMGLVFASVVFFIPHGNLLLENRVGDFFGRISYSFYLLHLPVLLFITENLPTQPSLQLIAFIGATSIFAYLSYRFLEVPSARIIRKALGPHHAPRPLDHHVKNNG